ncbi:MAG TPA: MDR family oxidoreductase [Thermoanaerobaculia bacterium]|nr:MDR family oxidoreductase [Thermoanaerobaculia bacterium]
MSDTFRALVARAQNDVAFETKSLSDLSGEVLIDVAYSSLNYKDGLAVTGKGRIVRRFPMVVGIDLAGTVVESSAAEFHPGDRVLGTGQGLGETDGGGYTTKQRVRAETIVKIPDALSLEDAMRLGTAGLTAMLSLLALEKNDVAPSEREVVVTGAAGGVGSLAVHLLVQRGYKVAALTGRPELESYLRDLGATSIVPRAEVENAKGPLQSERWAGAVDTVGGPILANVYAQTAYGGAVACCGMAASHELNATVWPLILRNVSLLGVSSLKPSKALRNAAWQRLAEDVDRKVLANMCRTEPLSNIFDVAEQITAGKVRGRILIDVNA